MRDAFAVELAVVRIDAELARELPAHVRAYARAYLAGTTAPSAPPILTRPATLAMARDADRRDLLRLVVPLAVERDPRVSAIRGGDVTWERYGRLVGARDVAAGGSFCEVMHALHIEHEHE
ncbi:MAG: hypothetical protein NT062_25650, partial [Proteobacteria bacterium]|nr:hypothetical protein [Pseudomonadota bacterium]